MKTKQKLKIIMFITILISLFFSVLFPNESLGVTTSQLENPGANYWATLQSAARSDASAYWNFNAAKLVRQNKSCSTNFSAANGVHYPNDVCIAPLIHATPVTLCPSVVMDVAKDGSVTITKYVNNGSTSKNYKKIKNILNDDNSVTRQVYDPSTDETKTKTYTGSDAKDYREGIKQAWRLSYYLYKAGNSYTTLSKKNNVYQSMARLECFSTYFKYFKAIGIPNEYDPLFRYTKAQRGMDQFSYNTVQAKIKESKKAIESNKQYYGRFVLLKGKNTGIVSGKKVNGQENMVYKCKVTNKGSSLQIIKKDAKTGKGLKGAEFKVTLGTKTIATLTTNKNGKCSVAKLKKGETYTIEETKPPKGYLPADPMVKTKTVKAGSNTVTFKNDRIGADTIIKYEEGTENPIEGAKLGYKNWEPDNKDYKKEPREPLRSDDKYYSNVPHTGTREKKDKDGKVVKDKDGKIVYETYTYYVWEFTEESLYQSDYAKYLDLLDNYNYYIKSQTEFVATGITGENGSTVLTGDIREGTYDLYEISCDNEYFEVTEPVLKVKAHKPGTEIKIENPRTRVDIEGWIWQEEPDDPKDPADNLLTKYREGHDGSEEEEEEESEGEEEEEVVEDSDEEFVAGVVVELKLNGSVVDSTVVKDDGYYFFEKLKVDELENYSVEVTYNGMYYKSIPVTFSEGDMEGPGSKMSDNQSSRNTFNNTYGTITKAQADNRQIVYYKEDYTSTVVYDTNYPKSEETEETFNVGCKQTTCPGFNIQASTKESGFNLEDAYHNQECITNVNLGLTIREQPDMTLVKDLDTVTININGEEHIYKYGERFKQALYDEMSYDDITNGYDLLPSVRYQTKYGDLSYTRAVCASDVNYGTGNHSNENIPDKNPEEKVNDSEKLKVAVTYKMGIRNGSATLNMSTDKITDYYENKYTNIEAGREENNDGTIKAGTNLSVTTQNSEYANYEKATIDANLTLGPGKEGYIYVRFEVKREEIVKILGDQSRVTPRIELNNIAEIAAYSTYEGNSLYGAIDIDSQPGSVNVENQTTYEDDTDKAPGFQLILQNERVISGTIFEDKTTGSLGNIRQGDGIFTNDDTRLNNMKISIEIQDETGNWVTAKRYDKASKTWKEAVIEKGGTPNGDYSLDGFIPGNYRIVYKWGDKTYKVQNYKSTIVEEEYYKNQQSNEEWYKIEQEKRRTDALDDYSLREKIDKQSEKIINNNKRTVEEYSGEMITNEDGTEKSELITEMESMTPRFKINIEEYSNGDAPNVSDEFETNAEGEVITDGLFVEKKDGYKNHMKNIDFGIAKRAKQELTLEKEVESARLTLANGTLLAEIKRDEHGKMQNSQYVAYIEPAAATQGLVRFEIDKELIEGAKLEITYTLRIKNTGEKDYKAWEFYAFGKTDHSADQEITLSVEKLIDYMNDTIVGDSDGGNWKVLSQDNINKLKDEGKYNKTDTDMNQYLGSLKNVLLTEQLKGKGLKAGEIIEIPLKSSKLLSNTNDEIAFDNVSEILEVQKSAGSIIETSTPGNFIPGKAELEEPDDSTSEGVTVLPPTGENMSYIAYSLLAISSLGILIAGIILIKKYVLK